MAPRSRTLPLIGPFGREGVHLEIIRTLHHVHTDLGVCCRRSEIAAVLKERDNKARKLY